MEIFKYPASNASVSIRDRNLNNTKFGLRNASDNKNPFDHFDRSERMVGQAFLLVAAVFSSKHLCSKPTTSKNGCLTVAHRFIIIPSEQLSLTEHFERTFEKGYY